jgi:hypothetical protein
MVLISISTTLAHSHSGLRLHSAQDVSQYIYVADAPWLALSRTMNLVNIFYEEAV